MKNLIVFLTIQFLSGIPLFADLVFESREISTSIPIDQNKYDFSFKFKNTGPAPVKILEIKNSCGCTTTENRKSEYAPNESGEITGSVKIDNSQSLLLNNITILAEGQDPSETKLTIKVAVEKPIAIKPMLLFWKTGDETRPKTCTIELLKDEFDAVIPSESENGMYAIEKISDATNPNLFRLKISPSDTAEKNSDKLKIALRKSNGFQKSYYIHFLVK